MTVFPTTSFPSQLYTASQVRELDRIAIQDLGISGYTLMSRAGEAVYRALRARWPEARRISVLCGPGNNGGDGYVVAALARGDGLEVEVITVGDTERLRGDALTAAQRAGQAGVVPRPFQGEDRFDAQVVVDALLGTGLDRVVAGIWREAIDAINRSGCPVIAVDIPSGLHADSGVPLGVVVRADVTVSFIGLKQGLLTGQGPGYAGQLLFHDLEVPDEVYAGVDSTVRRLEIRELQSHLSPRSRTAHKGHCGHLLVIGGDQGYTGAIRLAATAGITCGAGLVSVASRSSHADRLGVSRPELMCHGVDGAEALSPLVAKANVIAVGPGLGQEDWGREMLTAVLTIELPLVVDADGLNLVAGSNHRRDDWVLTPHPGEAARLLGCSTAEVQADRFKAVTELAERYGGVVVLKGAGTLVADQDGMVYLCDRGNPGMAAGGMGDVLTGVIGALVAQGLEIDVAARLGVCLHAAAGDLAARAGERGMLASDLFSPLRGLVNPVR